MLQPSGGSPFPLTRWTAVLSLRTGDNGEKAQAIINDLCKNYWYPIYSFARRFGHSPEDSQDLTQGFFCNVLDQNLFASARPDQGKMRTFLITAFRRYMGDVHERATALKRGGHEEDLSLEMLAGEDMYSWEPADESTPEKLYERTWAVSVLNTALKRLGELEVSQGRGEEFAAAEPFLSPTNSGEGCYQTLAERLGASETAARKMVSRLRQKFRDSLRDAIADTLRNPTEADVDDELRALKGALRN
jgi:RNA polymerase sigma-70 factor (ECF subfamily)